MHAAPLKSLILKTCMNEPTPSPLRSIPGPFPEPTSSIQRVSTPTITNYGWASFQDNRSPGSAIRGTRLLDANVRMFLGEKGVNRGIAETIKENPTRFAAYNNGVTMVVDDLIVEGGQVISAKNVSVVNGGQTTVSIFRAGRKGVDLAEVRVPLKVVHLTSEDDVRRKALLGNISRFANTQNSVRTPTVLSKTARTRSSSKPRLSTATKPIQGGFTNESEGSLRRSKWPTPLGSRL